MLPGIEILKIKEYRADFSLPREQSLRISLQEGIIKKHNAFVMCAVC